MEGDSTRSRPPGPGTRAGLAIALAFLLAGLLTLPDRGLTWDEPESLLAGVGNLEVLASVAAGSTEFEWPWHELRGHQFVIDTLRVLVARAAGPLVGGPEIAGVPIRGLHLFHLLLAAASLFLVHRLAVDVSGSVGVGVLSALLLATLPKLVAHSQNNPKDLVALFVYALFLWALERAIGRAKGLEGERLRLLPFAGAGAVLGFAFASHVLSALLVPIGGGWLLYRLRSIRPRGDRWQELLRIAAVLGLSSGLATFALWPWLWADPLVRTARAARRVVAFPLEMDVLHLGRLYPAAELPREYFLVHLAASTPLFVLAAAVAGAALAFRRSRRDGRRDLAVLALLWLGLPVVAEAFTSARYDGVRHLLCVLPALAVLAGLGIDALGRRLAGGAASRRLAAAALALVAGSWLWTLVDLARYHPYQDAYLNAATRRALALAGREPQEVFELEYWGAAYKEGAEWLEARAAEGAGETTVLVPFGAWCAVPWAGSEVTVTGDLWLDGRAGSLGVAETRESADYLMILPRPSFFTPAVERVRRAREPVHTVERLGATLLEIYVLE